MTVVNAPIAYSLTFTPVRGTKERTINVRDTAPVAIPDAPSSAAPVAIRARLANGDAVDYRLHGGHLWEPCGAVEVDVAEPKAKDFEGNPLVAKGSPLLGKDDVPAISGIVINPKKPTSSTREREEAKLQDAADLLLLIDGNLHRRSPGPLVVLKVGKAAREGSLVLTHQFDLAEDLVDSMIFRADQRALAEQVTRELFKRPPPVEFDAPQILMQDALKADAVEISMVRMGQRLFLRDVDAIGIGNLPTEFLQLYLDYTDPDFDNGHASPELAEMIARGSEMLKDVRDCGPVARLGRWMDTRLQAESYAFEGTRPSV